MSHETSLDHIEVSNYRLFSNLVVDFHAKLTVLVAANGCGKTSLLEAICSSFRLFVNTMEGRGNSRILERSDIRRVVSPENKMDYITPVRFITRARVVGEDIQWTRTRESEDDSRTTSAEASELKSLALRLRKENQAWAERRATEAPVFPIIAYYGTGRLWGGTRTTEAKKKDVDGAPNARGKGYTDCLSPSSHFGLFYEWFRDYSYEEKDEADRMSNSPHSPRQHLEALRNAVNHVLAVSGWRNLRWDFVEKTIVAEHPTFGSFPVNSLSDGIRTMIGLVGDIAHRAVRLNPQFGSDATVLTPGIVLIDEVDMHLHPAWQQVVVSTLQEAFPRVQFILTTHSPQVLTTVPDESIRVLENGIAHIAQVGSEGAEPGRLLRQVLGLSDLRPSQNRLVLDLREYLDLVQSDQFDSSRAVELRRALDERFHGNEPLLNDADLIIENRKWELGQ